MQTILVPTDFSLNANKALNYAAQVAKLSGAAIIILHVSNLTHSAMNENVIVSDRLDSDVLEKTHQELDILVSVTRDITQGKVEKQLYNGFVTDAIPQAALENKADLVIMGTLGNSGVSEKLFGSITAKLISSLEIPLLAVPLMYEWQQPKNILLAINQFSESPQVLTPLLQLAGFLKAPVHVSVFTNEDSAAAADYLQNRRDIELFCVNMQSEHPELTVIPAPVYGRHFEDAIKTYITENETGLLVMLTHKRNFIESIFNRSLTKKMSYHTDIPLLSIPIQS